MADISMCKSTTCTKRESCHRFTAEPNPFMQSYGGFSQDENAECKYYWDNKPQEKVIIEWSDISGRQHKGEMIDLDNGTAIVKLEDGSTIAIPFYEGDN
jgi:hypothetical protein